MRKEKILSETLSKSSTSKKKLKSETMSMSSQVQGRKDKWIRWAKNFHKDRLRGSWSKMGWAEWVKFFLKSIPTLSSQGFYWFPLIKIADFCWPHCYENWWLLKLLILRKIVIHRQIIIFQRDITVYGALSFFVNDIHHPYLVLNSNSKIKLTKLHKKGKKTLDYTKKKSPLP